MLKNPRNTTWLYKNEVKKQYVQAFQRFFILDFEATCNEGATLTPQEIIEFPCLEVKETNKNFQVLSQFHSFVKPRVHPILTPFCRELTGISQEAVESEKEFPDVFTDFLKWLKPKYDHLGPEKATFVTSGTWDLFRILPNQCELSNIDIPPELKTCINIKTAYYTATGYYPRSLKDAFRHSKMQKQGHTHRGLDDCYSILYIMRYLGARGFIFKNTDTALEETKDRGD